MALTVEDGTGKTDADSYLSEADCDTYWTNHGDPTDWSGAATADKEAALRMATQFLDMEYSGRWRGVRANETQSLDWPRYGVTDDDYYAIDSDAMPQALKDATAEAAYRHITETNGLMPDISEPGQIKQYTVKVGPIMKSTEYTSGKSQTKWFRKIDALLRSLIATPGRVERA